MPANYPVSPLCLLSHCGREREGFHGVEGKLPLNIERIGSIRVEETLSNLSALSALHGVPLFGIVVAAVIFPPR